MLKPPAVTFIWPANWATKTPWRTTNSTAWVTSRKGWLLLLAGLLILPFFSPAQDSTQTRKRPKVHRARVWGRFDRDTVYVGQVVGYWLGMERPRGQQAMLADSTYLPSMFALRSVTAYRTTSDSLYSRDSVLFTLQCFTSPGPVTLQLPGFIFEKEDTLRIIPAPDTLIISATADTAVAEPAKLKSALVVVPINGKFNYPFLVVIMAAALLLLLVVNQFLGTTIRQWVRLLLLYRRHRTFLLAFDRMQSQTVREKSAPRMERALTLWKSHLERLDGKPFTTYTTREIAQVIPDQQLLDNLQLIDRWVYGGMLETSPTPIFNILRRYALLFYQRRRQLIRNRATRAA